MATYSVSKIIESILLTTGNTNYYTVAPNQQAILKKVTFANYTDVDQYVTIHLVPAGDTPDDNNIVVPNQVVRANDFWAAFIVLDHAMNEGDMLYAKCSSGNSVNIKATATVIS